MPPRTDHLAKAKDYIAKGEDYYRKAAEEIKAAMDEDSTLSYVEIGRRLGRSDTWCGRLVRSYTTSTRAADEDLIVDWDSGSNKRADVVQQAARNKPTEIAKAIQAAPEPARRQIMAELAEEHETRQPMYEALSDSADARVEASDRRAREATPDLSAMGDELDAGHGMAKARRVLRSEVLPAIQRLDFSTRKGMKARDTLMEDLAELENTVGWIRSALESSDGSFDDELARILEEAS